MLAGRRERSGTSGRSSDSWDTEISHLFKCSLYPFPDSWPPRDRGGTQLFWPGKAAADCVKRRLSDLLAWCIRSGYVDEGSDRCGYGEAGLGVRRTIMPVKWLDRGVKSYSRRRTARAPITRHGEMDAPRDQVTKTEYIEGGFV